MAPAKILLTGATGYIGGSVLTQLLASRAPALEKIQFSCLVRRQEQADLLTSTYGDRVVPILFKDLDDSETIIKVASEHDIVINTTIGNHAESARSLVLGLEKRKATTGKDVFMLHTSGTSNMADQPISKVYVEKDPEHVFSDRDDIYTYEHARNAKQPYHQRTAELGVIDQGLKSGVKTLVIMSPLIYGLGTGLVNRTTIQVPLYMRSTLASGQAIVVGDGKGVWDHVHIEDLARLYEIVVVKMIEGGQGLPFGKQGIMFSGAGRHSWAEVARQVAQAAYDAGAIKSAEVKSVTLEEGAKALTGGKELIVELGFSSNSRTRADVAQSLGWKPEKTEEDFKKHFREEVDAVIKAGEHARGVIVQSRV
jgi:nucleoside-diphosphate-sugar epimerase